MKIKKIKKFYSLIHFVPTKLNLTIFALTARIDDVENQLNRK